MINIRKKCGGVMLKGIKAKIGIIIGILVLCGSTIGIMNAFADPNWPDMYYRVEPSEVVELDGTNAGEFSISVVPINEDVLIHSFGGTFPVHNPYITPVECGAEKSSSLTREDCDAPTGNFYSEYDDYTLFEQDEPFFTIHFTVSPDTPAGDYEIPIHFYLLRAQDINDGSDIDETMMNLYSTPQITVKRPQKVTFLDQLDEPITELTKYYGDWDYTISSTVTEGDGDIIDYYVKSVDYNDGVIDITPSSSPNSNHIHINKVGEAEICAIVEEAGLYLRTESCLPVHVLKRPIRIESISIADKEYDGTDSAEIDEIVFEWEDANYEVGPDDYITSITLDDTNVGNRTATVEIYLSETGEQRYTLSQRDFTVPARIVPADVSDIVTAGIPPQEYDPSVDYQPILAEVTIPISEFDYHYLEEGVDYELSYEGNKMYDEVWLTQAGDYNIAISPLQGSNYTFEPFEATFTILPRALTVTDASVNSKTFDGTYETSVDEVIFDNAELVKGQDYEAYAYIGSSSVGTWDARVYITLNNLNYGFLSEYNPGTFEYATSFDVINNVQVFPRELKSEDVYYYFLDSDDGNYTYTGEEIKPLVYLAMSFNEGDSLDDYYVLNLGEDFTIEYPDDTTNYGEKGLTLIGKDNFSGSIGPIEYFIGMATVQDVQITTPDQTYTGEPLEPEPIITAIFNGERITFPASEYDILHQEDFIDAGNYTYIAQESNNSNFHFSTTEATFTINPYEISSSDISLSESTYKYNGTSQTPSVTVTVGDTTIDENNYEVEFSADTIGNDESDTEVTVTVTAKEGANITGSASTTYVITPRDVLEITGIDDNQQIGYTGSPVVLSGNVTVEENEEGITADDLTITWYASDGTTAIDQPTNAGSYKVVYSYEDADYHGALVVNFEITKAESPVPTEMETDFRIASGQTLANLEGERTTGFAWVDSSTTIISGNNIYPATYTYNNDTINYETLNLNVPIYGLSQVDVIIPESEGGEITVSNQNVLEGETVTITITPDFGYTLDSITINGVDHAGNVDANTLVIVAGTSDLEIIATFMPIVYEVVEGAEQVYTIDEDSEAKFRINADYELFKNGGAVYVDDLLVDPTNYTSWDGSTYIKFTDEYLSTIAIGAHTLKVTFNDGGTATTTFTIAESEGDLATPNTGVFAMTGGGATTTVGTLAVILVVFMVAQRTIWKRQRKINGSKH